MRRMREAHFDFRQISSLPVPVTTASSSRSSSSTAGGGVSTGGSMAARVSAGWKVSMRNWVAGVEIAQPMPSGSR